MKDLFSEHAADYAKYRPGYPASLISFITSQCKELNNAWDCGTGNGQAALMLSETFSKVEATDISEKQLDCAPSAPNITYHKCPAESSPFKKNTFDLITVAQALHWFDFGLFFKEVVRVSTPDALLACWGYELLHVDNKVDTLITDFYRELDPYWQPERKFVEDAYETIPFPWEMKSKSFVQVENWNLDELCLYLSTWSAVKKAERETGKQVIPGLYQSLSDLWPEGEKRDVSFPLFLVYGFPKIPNS